MRKALIILALLLISGQLIAQASRTFTLTSNAPIRMSFGKDTISYMIEIQSIDGGGTAWVLNRSVLGVEIPVFVREAGTKTDLDKINITAGVIKRFYVLSNAISLLKIVYTGTGANVIIWGFTKSNSGWSIEPIDAIQQDASKLRVDVIGTDTVFVNNFTSSSGKDTVTVKKLINDTVFVRNNITVEPPTVDTIKYLKNGKIDVVGIDTVYVNNQIANPTEIAVNNLYSVVGDTVYVNNFPASTDNDKDTAIQSDASKLRVDVVGTDTVYVNNQPSTMVVSNLYSVVGDTVTITTMPVLTDKVTNANNNVIGNVSLGNSQGKTNVMKTGTLVTTATTADQVILTYTVTAGKTFYLLYWTVVSRLTTLSATASILGTISLETPSGTKTWTITRMNPTISYVEPYTVSPSEPIPVSAGTVIRVVCTPAAATSMTWIGNFGGYEK